MRNKTRIAVDAGMTLSLIFLMSYGLISEKAHEWIGVLMFVMFILHHALNRKWLAAVPRGRYNRLRAAQTVLAVMILLCILGSAVSGVILSRYVFAGLSCRGLVSAARKIHILCAYWGYVLMSVHLGLHRGMLSATMRARHRLPQLRYVGLAIALYGVYAFCKRRIWQYMFLISHFVFFDYSEPVIFFFLDYIAVMWLFVRIGGAAAAMLGNHSLRRATNGKSAKQRSGG